MNVTDKINALLTDVDNERTKQGLTLEELAKKSGVSKEALKQWRKGVATPLLYSMILLCDGLGLEIKVIKKA